MKEHSHDSGCSTPHREGKINRKHDSGQDTKAGARQETARQVQTLMLSLKPLTRSRSVAGAHTETPIHCHRSCRFNTQELAQMLDSLVRVPFQQFLALCAPAAFPLKLLPFLRLHLQIGSRHCHGGPLPCHRKLTSQKLERLVAKSDQQFIRNHQEHNRMWKEKGVRVWCVM